MAEPDTLTEAEIAAIVAVLSGDRIEPHVLVALGTGLRQGEQLGLAWEDIDGRALYVRKELTRIAGQYRRVDPKTPRSRRTVPLAPWVVSAFALQRERLVTAGFVPTLTGPVFVNAEGAELSGSVLTHRWYDLLARAGVDRRPWKVLRATFASRLYAAGVPDLAIADLLGHARTATTKRHYIASAGSGSALEVIARLGPDSHNDSHASAEGVGRNG
jgi:integrase